MCANTSGEGMWPESSRRLRSFQAGSMLWKTPGVSWAPYQPTPKPSPFVSSAPICECRLWTISEFFCPYRSSSSRTGEPEYASQRHIDQILAARRKQRVIPIGRCSVSPRAERLRTTNPSRRRGASARKQLPVPGRRVDDVHLLRLRNLDLAPDHDPGGQLRASGPFRLGEGRLDALCDLHAIAGRAGLHDCPAAAGQDADDARRHLTR